MKNNMRKMLSVFLVLALMLVVSPLTQAEETAAATEAPAEETAAATEVQAEENADSAEQRKEAIADAIEKTIEIWTEVYEDQNMATLNKNNLKQLNKLLGNAAADLELVYHQSNDFKSGFTPKDVTLNDPNTSVPYIIGLCGKLRKDKTAQEKMEEHPNQVNNALESAQALQTALSPTGAGSLFSQGGAGPVMLCVLGGFLVGMAGMWFLGVKKLKGDA